MIRKTTALDNPVWDSLQTDHRAIALGGPRVLRYPREYGPFVAVEEAGMVAGAELSRLIAPDEEVYILGAIPELPSWLRQLSRSPVLQMVCRQPVVREKTIPETVSLSGDDAGAMLELTAVAYPYFFRARTHELGRYFGIRQDGRLAAMAGERMSAGAYREVSGVCTHPDFVRRGYARRLIFHVVDHILADGRFAYLHVAMENKKAQELYRLLGFVDENVVPIVHLRRVDPGS